MTDPCRVCRFVARFIARGPANNIRRMAGLIGPLVRERIDLMEQHAKDGSELPVSVRPELLICAILPIASLDCRTICCSGC